VAQYSQHREEVIVRDFFGDRTGGCFVDVGAGHWSEDSTTYYLERHLGWSGAAVDARAELAAEWAQHRPRSRFFNYIVTDHSGTQDILFAAGPLSSTDRAHADAWGFPPDGPVRRVPTITLDELLELAGLGPIGFLSIDIERGEQSALEAFDICRHRPELVCMEVGFIRVRAWALEWFGAHGYRRVDRYLRYDTLNWWFTPAGRGAGARRGRRREARVLTER
jgi:FkbM family methyltransferase